MTIPQTTNEAAQLAGVVWARNFATWEELNNLTSAIDLQNWRRHMPGCTTPPSETTMLLWLKDYAIPPDKPAWRVVHDILRPLDEDMSRGTQLKHVRDFWDRIGRLASMRDPFANLKCVMDSDAQQLWSDDTFVWSFLFGVFWLVCELWDGNCDIGIVFEAICDPGF